MQPQLHQVPIYASTHQIVHVTIVKIFIGGGGFGKVYLGKLKGETQVAVKLLSASSNQGYKEFQVEVRLDITANLFNFEYLI
ncbi:putative leucine-rich repeat receptor-like serine/threonine-protein kinase [Quercus suber]|uniref:Leucine-rich repeat receptor-like serine/threonine-protein kinase n=1 Tax=Quercus suber TaxID=58331 RepID=A0AAW0LFG9_QUESU